MTVIVQDDHLTAGAWAACGYFWFPRQFPSLNTTFSKPKIKKQCFLKCFRCFVFSCCIAVAVAKANLLKTPAIVSLANFQRIQMSRHPRLAFDWLSANFFNYWPIRMSDGQRLHSNENNIALTCPIKWLAGNNEVNTYILLNVLVYSITEYI